MIGRAFKTLIPVCLISFLGFVVSEAVSSSRHEVTNVITEVTFEGMEEHSSNGTSESWEFSESYTDINLDVGSFEVELKPISGTKTTFSLTGTKPGDGDVESYISGSTLYLTTSSGSLDLGDFFERFAKALETGSGWDELFGTGKLVVGVPNEQYGMIQAELGSGKLVLNGVQAENLSFDVGSGLLICDNAKASDSLYLNMGSGKTDISGIDCESFNINIGSGVFDIDGITGSGYIEMGSGSGTLGFAEMNGDSTIEVHSGSLKVALPENPSVDISADIGTGAVRVNACGQNASLRDGNSITIGGGEYSVMVDLGSGSVSFVDRAKQSDAVATTVITNYAVEEVDLVEEV
ncbi:MAG: DUF4097 family beta strand repeat-containing protein [Oscillospiraceae bacterium]